MAEAKEPEWVGRFVGLLAGSEEQLAVTREALGTRFGAVEDASEIIPFSFTRYYEKEMGENLLRQWVRVGRLMDPAELAKWKLATNALEAELARRFDRDPAARPINIDPGYVHRFKVVLGSVKDAAHKIYLGDGIYGDCTLYWSNPRWVAWPWTYPDYQSEVAHRFLTRAREALVAQLKAAKQ